LGKVTEDGSADLLAFLRVKLSGHDVVLPDGGDELAAVIGDGADDGGVYRDNVVGVDEVDVGALGKALEEGGGAIPGDGVPAHVGNLEGEGRGIDGEADAFAGEDAQALVFTVFVADIDEELEAQADAQHGAAGFDVVLDGSGKAGPFEESDGVPEGAHAGDDEVIGAADIFRGGDDLSGMADILEGFLNAAEIGHAVIDDR